MSIFPLPVFEADADPRHREALSDQEILERLEPPRAIVVRFGSMKLVGEYPYDGDARPGCGSKLVARTHRGTELVEMLTTTCENAGCSKSVSRQEMLEYIANSGGSDFPFHEKGRILRVATIEDLNRQSALDAGKNELAAACKGLIAELGLKMKLVDVEPILGEELLTFYFTAEERVDFRELVRRLAAQFKTRIEMRQVGARDEARLVADYERCGQYCCCKNFLKVLRPVSMKAAKVQKATLDPLKISGRCGRLMCCLRYEDQTYKELKRRLPPRNMRVGTAEGPGVVVDGKILTQLVLVRLDKDGREVAIPVEDLLDPATCPRPVPGAAAAGEAAAGDALRGLSPEDLSRRLAGRTAGGEPARSSSERRSNYRRRSRSAGEGGVIGPRTPPPVPEAASPAPEAAPRDALEPGSADDLVEPTDETASRASPPRRPEADVRGSDRPAGGGRRRRRRRRGGERPGPSTEP
jgi:cell fate regulator YaaT (PSP1 superfamily)